MSNKLQLKGGIQLTPADFQGDTTNNYIYIDTSTYIAGDLTLDFKLWLDKDSNYHNQGFRINADRYRGAYIEVFSLFLNDSSIFISQYGGYYTHYSINDLDNQILECQILKNSSENYVSHFKINENIQTPTNTVLSSITSNGGINIGAGSYSIPSVYSEDLSTLSDATIWDMKITEVSTNTVFHYWKGEPHGHTVTAWEDLGTQKLDAQISTVSSERIIYSSGIPSNSTNKLLLNQDTTNKLLLDN